MANTLLEYMDDFLLHDRGQRHQWGSLMVAILDLRMARIYHRSLLRLPHRTNRSDLPYLLSSRYTRQLRNLGGSMAGFQ